MKNKGKWSVIPVLIFAALMAILFYPVLNRLKPVSASWPDCTQCHAIQAIKFTKGETDKDGYTIYYYTRPGKHGYKYYRTKVIAEEPKWIRCNIPGEFGGHSASIVLY